MSRSTRRSRASLVAFVGVLAACPARPKSEALPASASGRVGLRIPLPDGWVATPVGDHLEAGPPSRPALLLESKEGALPGDGQLLRLVEAEKVEVTHKESTGDFELVRYRLGRDAGAGGSAFVAVKQVGSRLVRCSSAPQVTPELLEVALATCRGVTFEAAR